MAGAAKSDRRLTGRVSAALRRRDAQLNVRLLFVMAHMVTIALLVGSAVYFHHAGRLLVPAIFGLVYAVFLTSLIIAVRDWKRHGIEDSPTIRRCAMVSAFSGLALAPFTPGGIAMQFQTLALTALMPTRRRIVLGGAAVGASVLILAYSYRITELDWVTGIQIASGIIAMAVMVGSLAADNLRTAAQPDPFQSAPIGSKHGRATGSRQAD